MRTISSYVEINTTFEGIHHWPECPYDEVSFLRYPHRHLIYVRVKVQTHTDRQIEFFKLKAQVDRIIDKLYGRERVKSLDQRSMETIGKEILERLKCIESNSFISISVSEDNQVRSIIAYTPHKKENK